MMCELDMYEGLPDSLGRSGVSVVNAICSLS